MAKLNLTPEYIRWLRSHGFAESQDELNRNKRGSLWEKLRKKLVKKI